MKLKFIIFCFLLPVAVSTSLAQTCGDALFVMQNDLTSNAGNPHPCIRQYLGSAIILSAPGYSCSGWAFQLWPGSGYLIIGPTVSTSRIVYDYDAMDNGSIRIFVSSSENGPWNQIDNYGATTSQCITASTPTIAQGQYVRFYQNPPSGHNVQGPLSIRSIYPETPAPVELTSFVAFATGSRVQLVWKTATETNNVGFEVQRNASHNGGWETIGFVSGHGTVNTPQSYAFSDAQLPLGGDTISYRLRQIDRDGTTEFSSIVTASRSTAKTFGLHSAYPNPFNPSTTISFNVAQPMRVNLAIIDKTGREVVRLVDNADMTTGSYSMVFTASRLPSGDYYAWLYSSVESSVLKISLSK
jgi:hypothetical protein